jgi:hypothetical protein
MRHIFQYTSEEEKSALISLHSTKYLVEEQNITEGKFLVFTDEPPQSAPVYVTLPSAELAELKDKIQPRNPDELFNLLDYNATDITTYKFMKIEQLNYLCNQTIKAGFTSSALGTPHQYKSDYDDQINTIGCLTLLNADSTLQSMIFKTVDAGFMIHTREQFLKLYKDGEEFKRNNITIYNTKKFQVLNALTKDEVIAIKWN